MELVSPFESGTLEAIAKVLGDTHFGLTGTEIGMLLERVKIPDIAPQMTKWKRLLAALERKQVKEHRGNDVIAFIHKAMDPARYLGNSEAFDGQREALNGPLLLAGYELGKDGRVGLAHKATTIDEAEERARQLRSALLTRSVHPDVLKFCRAELLHMNYFHAVLEAIKSVASKIRDVSGLTSDGAELVKAAFAFGDRDHPLIAINDLSTDTEKSEQRGFGNLLIGLFGMFRNPTAHAAKIYWPMEEQDALDILSITSLVHRKLDQARRVT